ncbi:GPI inositol-deacylase [Xylariaceae sp. FL1019]|nr:GPI inositol-deacylase [Xylariaceae sp. FL1019]
MQRRSSASSQDSADAAVHATRSRSRGQSRPRNAPSANRSSHDSRSVASSTRNRISNNQLNWQQAEARNDPAKGKPTVPPSRTSGDINTEDGKQNTLKHRTRHVQPQSPWRLSLLALVTSLAGIAILVSIVYSAGNLQCDPKGCRMSWMSPSYVPFTDFDTEHTRFASKYSLYLYREQGIETRPKVRGIPVLFIPGNAGSYKQVRSIASESARYFHETLHHDTAALKAGTRSLDFFTVDFNEDFTAFHGQTMLDQAEYVNEAIRYILSLYLDPNMTDRDPDLPDPSSVIILGHSMGGIVARTAFVMPNFQPQSINSIITMSAPHARAPVTFDPLIVKIYEDINDHWRRAYSEKSTVGHSLSHVTLVSIAGGGLDTVVPSDYASLESLVPETHGFTVFTSTIPNVWTSMDHQAITWCDQFRKVMVRTLYEIVDGNHKSQTKPRSERMRIFREKLLTGLERTAEGAPADSASSILLSVEDIADTIQTQERLVFRTFGSGKRSKAYLVPIPQGEFPTAKQFSLLSNSELDQPGENGRLEVLLCNLYSSQTDQQHPPFSTELDLAGNNSAATSLACKSASQDAVTLPASTRATKTPFFQEREQPILPFSYLEYDVASISDYQFVAIIDKADTPTYGWVVAELSNQADSQWTISVTLTQLITNGLRLELPAKRPTMIDVKIPSIQSSLLAYRLEVGDQLCGDQRELLRPLVRQYINKPYESKYFVDAQDVEINLHGVSPFVPPPLDSNHSDNGVGLQFWTDPTCEAKISIKLTVDAMGSLGKLYMRYRTVFASFPQLVVGLVLRKQFRVYDTTGTFIPFTQSLGKCIRQSLPILLLSMTFLSLSMGQSGSVDYRDIWPWRNSTTLTDFAQNDLLIGTTDSFFWFLIPMIGIVCIGVCVVMHYSALVLVSLFGFVYTFVFARRFPVEDKKGDTLSKYATTSVFVPTSPRQRFLTIGILLLLVSTIIPYQFAYVIVCVVQLTTCVRAWCVARETPSLTNRNFNNYVHTIFLLMVWNLPLNLPTVVVWVRNLTIHWFTPFSSHHNIISILPFILLVENLTAGRMIPPITNRLRHLTNILFFATAMYAAIYGVSHAYRLHYLVNLIAAWLVAVHTTADSWALTGIKSMLNNETPGQHSSKQSKRP